MIEMKYTLIIDELKEESIVVTAHKKNKLIFEIENLIKNDSFKLIGYKDEKSFPLNILDVYAFYTYDGKVYAKTKSEDYLVRERIYKIEEYTQELFVKINQGCLVNVKMILRFDSNIGGSIKVTLKNNFSDYISRRELKNVKRRIGL